MHLTMQNKTNRKKKEHLGGCQVNSTQRIWICFTKQHISDELLMGKLQANFYYLYNEFLKYIQKLDCEFYLHKSKDQKLCDSFGSYTCSLMSYCIPITY